MSRSRKRTPVVKMGYGKRGKQAANRSLRRRKDLPPGKSKRYKRFYPQWDVWDHRFYLSGDGEAAKKYRRK